MGNKRRIDPAGYGSEEERTWIARKSIASGYAADDENIPYDGKAECTTFHSDPFQALCWDCGSMILEHLDVLDLLRCEQVSKRWKGFVEHWIAVRGYVFFPETWNPSLRDVRDVDERIARGEEAAVKYAQYARVKTGQASGVRGINSATSFKVAGDFAAWTVGTRVFGRRLGFQANGAAYPTKTWSFAYELSTHGGATWAYHSVDLQVGPGGHVHVRIFRDGEFEDRMLLIQTGKELWRKTYPVVTFMGHHNMILTMTETLMYSASRMHNSDDHCYYYVHDLKTGDVWHWSPLADFTLAQFPSLVMRRVQAGGKERDVLVAYSFAKDTSLSMYMAAHNIITVQDPDPEHIDGLQVIDPQTGAALQTVRFPVCSPSMLTPDPIYLKPSPESNSELAAFCRHSMKGGVFVFKVDRFAFDAVGTLYKTCTEVMRHRPDRRLEDGSSSSVTNNVSIDPFRYIFLVPRSADNDKMPLISTMEPCEPFDAVDFMGQPLHANAQVDKWFQNGAITKITVPSARDVSNIRKSAASMAGRRRTANTVFRMDAVGENKLLLRHESWNLKTHDTSHYLFDFDYRLRPRALHDTAPVELEVEDTSETESDDAMTGRCGSTVSSTTDEW
ncbi:hypothetical protein BDW74DRAFT_182807 [Aspergillus multicolor]|uniref:F-box protein n=1 Tax=Aspergillus multicolor TaxID=41759 RepID=UPI003CCCA505